MNSEWVLNALVRALVRECAPRGRWQLAQLRAQRWQWRTPLGQYKVRAAQAVLQGLEQRGWLVLPPAINRHPPRPAWRQAPGDGAESILAGTVQDYRPLRWEVVGSVAPSPESHRETDTAPVITPYT